MSTTCAITLDHPDGVYNSGEVLNGHVKLETVKQKSIRGISIQLLGYAKNFWSEGQNNHFLAYEQYLNYHTYMKGSHGGNCFNLSPGIYNSSFSCALPIELPTSLATDKGKIKYKVIVTIDCRLRLDKVYKKEFLVNHTLDLNLEPGNKLPRGSKIVEDFAGGKVHGELQIPCGGYVSGQKIPFQLNIINDSKRDMFAIKIKLKKIYTFTSISPYESEKEIVEDILIKKFDPVLRHSNKEFKDFILLPKLISTQRTKLVRVDYILKFKMSLWFKLQIPVIIGTIPIAADYSTFNNSNNIDLKNIPPVSNFNIYNSLRNRNDECANINSNNSYIVNGNSINPNDVTIIKSTGGVLNKNSFMGPSE